MNERSEVSIHSICRICLNHLKTDAAYDIFLLPDLAKKLCVCTSLSVEPDDGFPKSLCTTCYTKLYDLHSFHKQCVDSVQKFREMVANNYFRIDNVNVINMAEFDGEVEDDGINFDPLMNSKIEIVENEEDVFKMLDDVDTELNEVKNVSSEDGDSDSDKDNDFDFGGSEDDVDFEPNSSESDDDKPLSRLKITRSSKTKKVNDSTCDGDEESKKPKVKPERKRIPAKKRRLHNIFECHICHQKFNKAIRYEEHMKLHNDLLPFQCEVETCKKGFSTAAGLRTHIDHTHIELCKLHPCTVEGCDMSFPRVRMLTLHLKKVHDIHTPRVRQFPCTECEKVYRCSTALKKHMFNHTGQEKPYACTICDKRFRIHSQLKEHLLRHAGIKKYVCPYCGVGKITRREWNRHILTHTKEKTFKCTQCDHTTHNKQALTYHVKVVHLKIKGYACQYCGKAFARACACRIHERIHTGANHCKCKICGEILLSEKKLTKHLQLHKDHDVPPTATDVKPSTEEDAPSAQNVNQEIKMPAEVKPIKVVPPRSGNRLEVVDISQLAGTSVNPFPKVSVPSDSPHGNLISKDGKQICPICERGFCGRTTLKRHLKVVHEKIKDYICRYCPKRFGKSQYLRHHEYTHTGERPYGCKLCDRHFTYSTSLRKHMMSHNRNISHKGTKSNELCVIEGFATERAAAATELLAQQLEESESQRNNDIQTLEIKKPACE